VTVVAWSTREIAELAGTSLRAVRHYHEVGLLEEPERRANGYKQYGVAHLLRLLRIKRLTDLGFSLPQVAAMGDADDHPEQALRTLDAELAATIERLHRARAELALILEGATPSDLPPEIAPAATDPEMSEAGRSFISVMTRVLGPQGLQAYADMLATHPDDPVGSEFAALPAEADETTRAEMAQRLASFIRVLFTEHPGLNVMGADAPRGRHHAAQTAETALTELFNPAQLDVFRRAQRLLATPKPDTTPSDEETP
jgi:DNA-binding transcriptional MerR regulator